MGIMLVLVVILSMTVAKMVLSDVAHAKNDDYDVDEERKR